MPRARVWTREMSAVPIPEGHQPYFGPFWSSYHAQSQEVGKLFYPPPGKSGRVYRYLPIELFLG